MRSRRERQELLAEIRRRRNAEGGFVRRVLLPPGAGGLGHAAAVPAVRALRDGLELHPRLTFVVGENGSGKSTLVEAIAVASGMNPEGGGRSMRFTTRASHSPLGYELRVTRGPIAPANEFFLRAESVFQLATKLDEMVADPYVGEEALEPYGGASLHEQSHGESFLAIALHRLGPDGLYVLDEPEAALSAQNQLTLLRQIDELTRAGCQFVVATHSPLLLAHPDCLVLLCDEDGVRPIDWRDAPSVRLTEAFLGDPERFVRDLLGD